LLAKVTGLLHGGHLPCQPHDEQFETLKIESTLLASRALLWRLDVFMHHLLLI